MIKPWETINSQPGGDYGIFRVRKDRKISPRTGREHDFFVIDTTNWVNIVATTTDNQLIFVEQYRHGSNTVELEVPGGVMDAKDASPEATAARELREETGFEGGPAKIIGRVFPNPAIMSNTCFVVLIENCELKHPVEWDHGEDLMNRLVPIAAVPDLITSGQIRHSLVVVALCHYELWRKKAGKS